MKHAKIDIAYCEARNKCIPEAERYANDNVGDIADYKSLEMYRGQWNRLYFGRMDELVKERGIV